MRILALDQGTSATKALVVGDGDLGDAVEFPVAVHATPDGAVTADPEELWASVVHAGTAAIERNPGRVDAIGLANQGETILAWDRTTGRPLSPCIVWQDRRSSAICEAMAPEWSDRLAAITGLELDPYFVAPKVAWLREQVGPEPVITTTDTWLLHRLTGAFATDVSTASRSLLLDLDSAAWSDGAAAAFGIDTASLPAIVANATTSLGETGAFGGSVPVTGVCVDQQAALFAEACHDAGEAKCTYGTGAFLLASTGNLPTRSANGLVGCVAWQLGDEVTWCLDGQVYTVGSTVSWLQDVGVIGEPSDLDRLGGAVVDAGGVWFVPGLAGLAAPFWRPNAKGSFTGLSLATSRGHLVRALIEGIAASVACLVRATSADLGRPLTRLRVDGGVTRSRTLLQAQADIAQVPIEVYPSPHATALGVAAFARLGAAGTAMRAAEALDAWAPSAVVEPSWSSDRAESFLDQWMRHAERAAEG